MVNVPIVLSPLEAMLQHAAAAPDSGNTLLPTPSAYELVLAEAGADTVSAVRYGAPWCSSCRTMGPDLQALVAAVWPNATFYELQLVRDGKAAGERMNRHYKRRGVRTMPFIEVFVGSSLVQCFDARKLNLQSRQL